MIEKPSSLTQVVRLVAEVFMIDADALTPQSSADDVPGWDSVSQVTLIMRLEDEFGIEIDVADFNEAPDLQGVTALVDKQKSSGWVALG
jgi:acyl carrier protein